MKVAIECKSRDEADAIKRAMSDPVMRAMVLMNGYLAVLPDDIARARVIRHVRDKLNNQ